jgi:hypothetical protein
MWPPSCNVALGSGQNCAGFVCCTMLPTDPLLFDPDDLPASAADRSLAIRSAPGRPLGKEERAFNRALTRLRALNRALDQEKRRLDRLLVFHAAEIRPRTDRAVALRVGLVRALTPFFDGRRLTKAQHQVLRRILVEQLDDVLMHLEKPDPDLQALLRLHPRYAPLIVDGAFGLPMVIDAPREIERLNTVIAQLRSALERLSSRDALDEVRCAIREYRDAEKRRMLGGQRRH